MGIVLTLIFLIIGSISAALDGDFSGLEMIGKGILFIVLFLIIGTIIINPVLLVLTVVLMLIVVIGVIIS